MTRLQISACTGVITALLSGCASSGAPSGEFLAPISEESVDLFGQVRFGIPLQNSVLLYQYLEQGDIAIDEWEAVWGDLTTAAVAMVDYSVAMVDLVQTSTSETSIESMIVLIGDLHRAVTNLPSTQSIDSELDYEDMISTMRQQDSIKDALAIALPEIEFVSDVVRQLITKADEKLAPAVRALEKMIDDRHGSIRHYSGILAARRAAVLEMLTLIDNAYNGDEPAFRQILAGDWAIRNEVGENAKFDPTTIITTEKLLMKRLEKTADIREFLEPAYRDYQSQLEELYEIQSGLDRSLGVTNLVIQGWEHSQRQLARGEKSSFGKLTASLMQLAYYKGARL